jgi:hypothetical protein
MARDLCEDLRSAHDQAYAARAPLAELQKLARNKSVACFIAELDALAEGPPVPGVDLSAAATALREALALPVRPSKGEPGKENVRAELLRLVFSADPDFSCSGTEWSYFGIASMGHSASSGDVLREKLKPGWELAIRSAHAVVARWPIPTLARRVEMQADLRGEAIFTLRERVRP